MEYEMKLSDKPFEKIKSGKKKIEVRLCDEKRRKINIGDIITFYKLPDKKEFVKVKVIGLSRFSSFKNLYAIFDKSLFDHPPEITLEEQIGGDREIYSIEREKEFGVLGIHIVLI
jgi:ASC-1-like (ASCH) protein